MMEYKVFLFTRIKLKNQSEYLFVSHILSCGMEGSMTRENNFYYETKVKISQQNSLSWQALKSQLNGPIVRE